MTTDTESLRQKFERHIVATGRSDGELIFEAGHYLYPDVQEMWELYQAGYAAAKAETVASKGRWYVLSGDGMATLCADEDDAKEVAADADLSYPRMAPHRAVQLVPAEQLAAAVAANSSEHAHAMAVLRQIADMPRRTREQRLASACVRFLDAIRAGGAKEAGDG